MPAHLTVQDKSILDAKLICFAIAVAFKVALLILRDLAMAKPNKGHFHISHIILLDKLERLVHCTACLLCLEFMGSVAQVKKHNVAD